MLEVPALIAGIRRRFKRRTAPGAMPGTVVSDPHAPPPQIRVFSYGPDELIEQDVPDIDRLRGLIGRRPVTWVNVDGLGDAATITQLGDLFNLHPLALEDVVHVHQRAKVDDYETHLYIVARMVELQETLATEQISLFLGENFVLTFQERPGDSLESVRQRLRKGQGRIRRAGPDYLAYSLLDAVIDGYFPIVEEYGDRLDDLDDLITEEPTSRQVVGRIHQIRRDLLTLRRAIWPHREAVNALLRDVDSQFSEQTRLHLRDCYDHTVQIIDVVETYREMCSDLRDVYLSAVSNRTNDIMKVLTIMATIFIPLGFIAGVYGMNFDYMPELHWHLGYFFALGLMGTLALGMLVYFWFRGWIRS